MRLTRRQALGGALAAGAGALLGPATAGAVPGRRVWSRWVGALRAGEGQPLSVGRFALAGIQWAGPESARIELRARLGSGRWSPWAPASTLGHDGDARPRGRERFGEPVWFGAADTLQLRSSVPAHRVRLHLVAASPMAASAARSPGATAALPSAATASLPSVAAAALALAPPVLDAGPGQPPIIARRAWAAGHARPARPARYGTIELAFVHHTVNPNGYGAGQVPSLLLAIFDYHRYVRGFFDIAYNFLIDAYGRIWEGRAGGIDEPVIGAHAGGYNGESTGVAMLGTFSDVSPSPAALDALERLLAWKLSLHGVPALGRARVRVNPSDYYYTPFRPGQLVWLHRISGHRDGDLTDCPGNALYHRLPSLRPPVAALAGQPLRLTLAASAAAVGPGANVTLSGTLSTLTGQPVAGAPVEVQRVLPHGALTLAIAATDAAGAFASSLTAGRNLLVRALHRPAPAAVSDPAFVGVVPLLTLALVSRHPLVVEGTVSPLRASVVLDVYGRAGGHHRLLARRRARVHGGRFRARLHLGAAARRHRQLIVVARVAAGQGTLAGRSPSLTVIA